MKIFWAIPCWLPWFIYLVFDTKYSSITIFFDSIHTYSRFKVVSLQSRFASSRFATIRSQFATQIQSIRYNSKSIRCKLQKPKSWSLHSLIWFATEFELENFSRTFVRSTRMMELCYISQFPRAMIIVLRNRWSWHSFTRWLRT